MFSLTGSATTADENGAAGGRVPFIRDLSLIAPPTMKAFVMFAAKTRP
ncbi:MAG: hypothetical protein ACO3I1_06775 [Burkholderiales bacterium]